jgi:threonine/homoserine/homoserine lactone efflux protein
MELIFFLAKVVGISLSGVMAPGPITAATVAMGTKSLYAGPLIAIGHGIIEFPLMVLIILGMGKFLKSTKAKMIIGLAGGAFLLFMAIQMLMTLGVTNNPQTTAMNSSPILTGVILSASNPYFLLWWATVGLRLATDASRLGILVFSLFAVVHWLCDFIWLGALSWASFKGTGLFGPSSQLILLVICSLVLLIFGLFFIYKAVRTLIKIF